VRRSLTHRSYLGIGFMWREKDQSLGKERIDIGEEKANIMGKLGTA